jgi:hypothetical protein
MNAAAMWRNVVLIPGIMRWPTCNISRLQKEWNANSLPRMWTGSISRPERPT